MNKGDIWLPQKMDPMPGKIPDAFNHRGTINTWPQIDLSGHYKGGNIIVSAPWQERLLILSYNEGMFCHFPANY